MDSDWLSVEGRNDENKPYIHTKNINDFILIQK